MSRDGRFFLILMCGLFVLVGTQSFAQITQSRRFEKEFKSSDGYFTVLSMRDEGLLLIRDKEKYEGGKKLWELIFLDTALQQTKIVDLPVEQRNRLIGYDYVKGHILLLFRVGDTNKSDLELVQVNIHNDDRQIYTIEPELNFGVTHFIQVGASVVFGGYVNKDPAVLLYNMAEKSIKVLPGFFQKDTELVDLRTNQNKTFNVVLIERAVRDKQRFSLRTYDESGSLLLEDDVAMDPKISLQTGMTSTLEREDMLVSGTWGERNNKQANGFYAIAIDPFKEQKVNYFAFGELAHYFDNMKPSRAKRIQEKSIEEVKAGGVPNYVAYVMPYRLMEYPKGFIMLAEVYNPSSSFNSYPNSNNPYSPYGYNPYYSPYGMYSPGFGRFYTPPYGYNNTRSADEVKTMESVVISFTPQGKIQWDFSLPIDDVKLLSLEQVSDFHYYDSKVVILYKLESELKAKRIVQDDEDEEMLTEKITTQNANDEIKNEREHEGGVRYWLDDDFYVWGYHTVRNSTLKEKTRDVFYINKITVH